TNGAGGQRVGVNDIDRAVVDEIAEALFETEEALAGGDRGGGGLAQFAIRAPVFGSVAAGPEMADLDHVLGPCEVVALEGTGVADAVVNGEGAEMVGGEGRRRANRVADGLDVLAQVLQAFFGGDAAAVDGAGPIGDEAGPD